MELEAPFKMCSISGESNMTLGEIYEFLEAFSKDRTNLSEEVSFPSTLSDEQRREIHQIAETFKLNHESRGTKGKDRYLVISKPSQEVVEKALEKGQSKFDKIPHGVSEILTEFLYLGSARDAKDKQQLLNLNIQCVLNCAKEWKNYHTDVFTYYSANFLDTEDQNMSVQFGPCFTFIAKKENKKILVHCIVGKSRSAALVIAYLMKSQGMTLREAYDHVKCKRNIIQPNEGFMEQLIQFELQLHQKSTMNKGDWVPILVPTKQKVQKTELSTKEISKAVKKFTKKFLNQELLERAIEEACEGSFEKRKLGHFLSWVSKTINEMEEAQGELNELGLKWKDVTKSIGEISKEWFLGTHKL